MTVVAVLVVVALACVAAWLVSRLEANLLFRWYCRREEKRAALADLEESANSDG